MAEPILISVCGSCALSESDLRAELRRLRQQYGDRLTIIEVDCLDACDHAPAISVDGVVLAPVTPAMLRRHIEGKIDA